MNRKADISIETLVKAALYIILIILIVGALIFGVFRTQIFGVGRTTEEITLDCDNDGATGILDECPCDSSKTDLDKQKTGDRCGATSQETKKTCPLRCA